MADRVLELLAPVQAALEASPLAVKITAAVGCLVLSRLALQVLGSVYTFFLRPAKSLKGFGQWGVVTGATDGIGKALAMELARKGMNVVLLSRTQSRLEAARDEILAKYPKVEVEILAVDFNRVDEPSVREALQKKMDQVKDVGVLFNNVGVSYDFPEFFDQLPEDRVDSLIKLNVAATTIMTKLVLPAQARRGRQPELRLGPHGRAAAQRILGHQEVRGAANAVLAAEYAAKNVHIQCHVPMFVSTKLAKIRHSSFMVPSPATYARASVAQLGYDTLISPYWPHALQIWLYESAPTWLLAKAAMMTHLSLRKRALKKLEAKKNQ
ncbi:COP9 signalosome complex subunit 4 [Phytophthora nicotianae]|uniref:COP9 signalosome complex subunit 4 n=1 Tax=Phytophthora nicotianae TaxID=4792 RepID=A0A0W8DG75_PHYNI|nr:COP9 signalosome complex subunit 4 [Phytophthora nicotianae]